MTEEKKTEPSEESVKDASAEAADAAETENAAQPEKSEKPAEPEKPSEPEKPAEPDWKDRYARLLADFDNFKKRTARDREDTYRYAESDILKDILPTIDNLQLALDAVKPEEKDGAFVKGVRLVHDNLLAALKDHGAEMFESVGKDLDTDTMEAIAHLPSADVPEGKVSIESKKGWMLKGKVLRAAQVVVSAGAPEAPAAPEEKNG